MTREIVAGGSAVAGLAACTALHMGLAVAVPLGLLVYGGMRLLLPAAGGADPAGTQAFLALCRREIDGMDAAKAKVPPGAFRDAVDQLCWTSRKIVKHLDRKPEHIRVASTYPEKLTKLAGMLAQYVELAASREDSDSARSALDRTEQVFGKSAENSRRLLDEIVSRDAMALTIDARVYEELMDLD
jgi:hypothetical protein